MQKACGDFSHALNIPDIFVAADQQSVVRRVSQRARSTTQVVIGQVQIIREETFLPITAVEQMLLNNILQWMLRQEQAKYEANPGAMYPW